MKRNGLGWASDHVGKMPGHLGKFSVVSWYHDNLILIRIIFLSCGLFASFYLLSRLHFYLLQVEKLLFVYVQARATGVFHGLS